MSDARLDELAQMSRNRGLKLVRSRVRTPGKRRFGKVGLADSSGKSVFGLDAKGPNATPDAVHDYLRGLEAKDWGASLQEPERMRSKRGQSAVKEGASFAQPTRTGKQKAAGQAPARTASLRKAIPPPMPRVPPKPELRAARARDAERLAELICELGHPIDAKQVRRNLAALGRTHETPLVVLLDGEIVGLCGIGKRVVISRTTPVGRITSLIVTRAAQGKGIGRLLVDAAEAWMRKEGCMLVEVTSNDRRAEAHAFYRHLGYERTSIRFAKPL